MLTMVLQKDGQHNGCEWNRGHIQMGSPLPSLRFVVGERAPQAEHGGKTGFRVGVVLDDAVMYPSTCGVCCEEVVTLLGELGRGAEEVVAEFEVKVVCATQRCILPLVVSVFEDSVVVVIVGLHIRQDRSEWTSHN